MIPIKVVRERADLGQHKGHLYLHPDGVPALVSAVADQGGELWGGPGTIRGGKVEGIGPVFPIGSIANGAEDMEPGELGRVVSVLRQLGTGRSNTGGSAGWAMLRRHLPDSEARSLHPTWRPIMADTVFGGPVEWRARLHAEPCTYLDQVSAFLSALSQGIPSRRWSMIPGADRDTLWRYLDRPEMCVVATVTAEADAALLPRRLNPWGPTVLEAGRTQVTARGPVLSMIRRCGARIVAVHGLAVSRRIKVDRMVEQLEQLRGFEAEASKAIYQRLWGKLAALPGMTGRIGHRPTEPDPDGVRVLRSREPDDQGMTHVVEWGEPSREPRSTGYRPDISGEITAWSWSRTVELAHYLEEAGRTVALLHVDAVLVGGEARAPDGWAVKAQGLGTVYGHGRYHVVGEGGKVSEGRMGLGPDDVMQHSSPSARDEERYSSRVWRNDWESDPAVSQDWPSARSGAYPWT